MIFLKWMMKIPKDEHAMRYTSLRSISRSSLVQSRMISSAPCSDCSSYNNPTCKYKHQQVRLQSFKTSYNYLHDGREFTSAFAREYAGRSMTEDVQRRTQKAGRASRKGRGPQSAPLISKYFLSLTCRTQKHLILNSNLS